MMKHLLTIQASSRFLFITFHSSHLVMEIFVKYFQDAWSQVLTNKQPRDSSYPMLHSTEVGPYIIFFFFSKKKYRWYWRNLTEDLGCMRLLTTRANSPLTHTIKVSCRFKLKTTDLQFKIIFHWVRPYLRIIFLYDKVR